jgi:hypothetical protein
LHGSSLAVSCWLHTVASCHQRHPPPAPAFSEPATSKPHARAQQVQSPRQPAACNTGQCTIRLAAQSKYMTAQWC